MSVCTQIHSALQMARTALEIERRTYTFNGMETVEEEVQPQVDRIDLTLREIAFALAALQRIEALARAVVGPLDRVATTRPITPNPGFES